MKLHLENIGPIDAVDINVDSDLTFIYGKNNIGKSYAITILYLILKNFVFDFPNTFKYFHNSFPRLVYQDNTLFIGLERIIGVDTEYDITDNVTQYFSNFFSSFFLSYFENSLLNSF
jgi:predicted ATPase